MKIYSKILVMAIPLALASLICGAAITYYLSKQAVEDLAHQWLQTRLSQAMAEVAENESFLKRYRITNIASGVRKAQYDAIQALAGIEVGKRGFVFIIDRSGIVVAHPEAALVGTVIGGETWFTRLQAKAQARLTLDWQGVRCLALYRYFAPWEWYVIVADPVAELYGPINNTRRYILISGCIGSILVGFFIVFLTRRLTAPLKLLVEGAKKVGDGRLETRIPVQTGDELGHLSQVFNTMATELQASIGSLQLSERYFRSLIENAPGIITLLEADGRIKYASPAYKRVLGYDPQALVGQPLKTIIHPRDREEFDQFFDTVSNKALETHSVELRFRHRNESVLIIETIGRNLIQDPAVSGMVLNSRNTTARRQMEEALKESQEHLRQLTSHLLTAQEEERQRLSIELHDELGQALTVMKLKLAGIENRLGSDPQQVLPAVEQLYQDIDQMIENIRRLCRDLAPSALEDLGLTAALYWQIETMARLDEIDINPSIDSRIDPVDDLFTQAQQILIYRIFQESFANIVKHAGADTVMVAVTKEIDAVEFVVEDNGIGFEPQTVNTREFAAKGLGLAAMTVRARMLGAAMTIDSSPGEGTRIAVTIPLSEDVAESHQN